MSLGKHRALYLCFALAIAANVAFWVLSHEKRVLWRNVPPVPSSGAAMAMGLGDSQFAYRAQGLMLQNLGDTGGQETALRDYDYAALEKWFYLADSLDPHSNYMPMLAAWYFGATTIPAQLGHVVDYLKQVGQRPYGEKWRWLAYAVTIAWHGMGDMDKALDLANLLARGTAPGMPVWTRSMPALVLTAKGDKAAAYTILMGILSSDAENMDPAEVNNIRIYICDRVLDPPARKGNPLCQNIPGEGALKALTGNAEGKNPGGFSGEDGIKPPR